jgi:HK97 family phage prohead protease
VISDKPWSQFSESDYTPEQWRRACLIDTGVGDADLKGRYKLPVREPDGTLNRNGVHAAAGRIGQVSGIGADMRRAAAHRLIAAYHEIGDEPPQGLMQMAGGMNGRSDQAQPWADTIMRTLPLDDVAVRGGHITCERCGKNATGRMVDAYAAVFNVSAEIHDQHGRYNEVIDPVSFNRTLKNEIDRVGVYYHHGMTLHGTPSGEGSYPLGHPSAIRTDNRGLLTSTHYSENDVGERALTLIKEGTITGQSFSGSIRRSDPHIVRGGQLRPRKDGTLPTVRRLELGLREYGPTPSPAYTEAQILATRAAMGVLYPDQRSEGLAGWAPPPPSDMENGAEDSRVSRSGRQKILRLKAELRRMELSFDGK